MSYKLVYCLLFLQIYFRSKFSELVGPNNTIIGILAKEIMCIIPLSIEIAFSSLEDKALTSRTGKF